MLRAPPMDVEAAFRRRLRQLIREKFRSLDRFYLETGLSKGHLSEILRGRGSRGKVSTSVATLARLAKLLDDEVRDFFVFPERGARDHAADLLRSASPEAVRQVVRMLGKQKPPRPLRLVDPWRVAFE